MAEIRRLGERTIDQSGGALINEVRRVLAGTTPALAIGKLHLKDYKLPLPIAGKPTVTGIRRTSLRVRNPANSPDAADLAALETIRTQLERGDDVAKVLVQRVTLPGLPPEWRVYRPLAVLKQFNGAIETDVYDVLSLRGSLKARNLLGGTAPVQVRAQIARHRARLG